MSPIHEPGTVPAVPAVLGFHAGEEGRFLLSRDGRPWCSVDSLLQAVVLGMRLGYDAEDRVTGALLVAVEPTSGPILCVGGLVALEREGLRDERSMESVRGALLPRLERVLAERTQAEVAALAATWEGEPADPSLDIE